MWHKSGHSSPNNFFPELLNSIVYLSSRAINVNYDPLVKSISKRFIYSDAP